ncbi:hypothetical protein [Mangrovimonas aestuarii]|uniref:hypothetical protein n=1 Tax=Mangrovimonas aestuarii TaxID=3018443 RepID=UPI00237825DB|nr:hypothetical protein [Mangrovimonas aestuarii]
MKKNYLLCFICFTITLIFQSCNSESKTNNSSVNEPDNSIVQDNLPYNLATIDFKKTQKERTYDATLTYYPEINKNSFIYICLSTDVKADFSNIDKIEFDTIPIKNGKFPIIFQTGGSKILRGFVLERYPINPRDTIIENEPLRFYELKTYLEQKINVE